MRSEVRYNPPLHRITLLTTAATFPLIFMGGLVTSHGAGMSVPDWPNSYGYNMFTFPPSKWVGGILYEHTHRLMGTIVGFCSILLVLFAWGTGRDGRVRRWLGWAAVAGAAGAGVAGLLLRQPWVADTLGGRTFAALPHAAVGLGSLALVLCAAWNARVREPRRWVRWLATGVLGAVIFQGVLGGLRVVMVELDLAIVHACFAQAFFCLAALTAVVTSKWWVQQAADSSASPHGAGDRGLVRVAVVAVVAVFLQLVVGAVMRHYDAGLAIPDVPLAYGRAVPPVSEAGLELANEARVYELGLSRVTLAQVWLHFGHRIGAVVVTAALFWLIGRVVRRHRGDVGLKTVAAAAVAWFGFFTGLAAAHAVGSSYGFAKGVGPGAPIFTAAVLSGIGAALLARRMGLHRPLLAPAALLAALLVVQVTLGVLTVLLRKPADVASAHVAVGALTLVTAFVLLVRSARLYSIGARPARATPAFEVVPAPAAGGRPLEQEAPAGVAVA